MAPHWRRESHELPPPPQGGVPVQQTPGWVRWPIRLLVAPFILLDIFMQKSIQKILRTPYRIEGTCKTRGTCCHYILLGWSPVFDKAPWFGNFWLWWYTEINGFYPRGFEIENEDGNIARVMSCRYLKKNGRCRYYWLRPGICRQWPLVDFISKPVILKGCGFFSTPNYPDLDLIDETDTTKSSKQEAPKEDIESTEQLEQKISELLQSNPPNK